jgi:quercetin dioxygenase-like cupin family protein
MRRLLAELVSGSISRREFAERILGMGFGVVTAESILDTVAVGQDKQKRAAVAKEKETFRAEPFSQKTPYEQWMSQENVPIHTGYFVADVRKLEVRPWKRLRARGALIDLTGAEGTDAAYVFELAPGNSTKPQRYMFEEAIYVLDGEGQTSVWQDGKRKETFKWKKGSIFSPPLNVWREHTNLGKSAARLISFTDLPLMMDLFHSAEFLFENDFVFRDRYDYEPGYFSVDASKLKGGGSAATFGEEERAAVRILDTGLVPDINELELYEAKSRGAKNKSIEMVFSDNVLQTHISEFETGSYKRAHRHGPGSHVLVLNGVGYTLAWKDTIKYSEAAKDRQVRVDWKDGTLLVPPDRWFHQHFNSGETSAKYMAATWIGGKYFVKGMGGGGRTHRLNTVSVHQGGNMIDYADEDPVIRAIFEEETRKHGIKVRMPDRTKGDPHEKH